MKKILLAWFFIMVLVSAHAQVRSDGFIDPSLFHKGPVIRVVPGIQVPFWALPPINWQNLLSIPDNSGSIVFPDGTTYVVGSPLQPNAVIPAGMCWAVPPQAPGPMPPGFNGYILLPNGASWRPGSFMPPNTAIWSWMCANWVWRARTNVERNNIFP